MDKLFKISGMLFVIAGILLLVINIVFTPQLLAIESYEEGVTTYVYAWRLGLACFTALSCSLGSIGLFFLYHKENPNKWTGIILLFSLIVGNSMLLAHEWNQFLFVRELALSFPGTLEDLNELEGFSLYDLSAIFSVSIYFLGWLIGTIILWKGKVIKPIVALLIVGGLIASPLLAAFLPVVYAGIIASILLASGWLFLARILFSAA